MLFISNNDNPLIGYQARDDLAELRTNQRSSAQSWNESPSPNRETISSFDGTPIVSK